MTRATIKNFMANIVAFLMIFTILSGVYFIALREVNFIWLLLVIPFLLMQFIRARAINVYAFSILHVVLAAVATLAVANSETLWFVVAFMVMAVVYSFIVRIIGERSLDTGSGVLMMILHVILFILVGLTNASPDIIRQQLIATCLVALGMVIIYIHMDNVDAKLKILNYMDKRTYRADKILSTNNSLIVVFIAIVGVVGLIATAFPLGRIIANGFRAMTSPTPRRQRGRAIPGDDHELPVATEDIPPTGDAYDYYEPGYAPYEEIMPYDNGEHVFVLLSNIVFFIILLIILVGVIYAFYQFIMHFTRRRKIEQSKADDDDETVTLDRNIVDDLKDLLPKFNRYSKNAIRRAYAKKINWHIRRGTNVQRSDTTDIIANKIRATENIDELTAQYEKVRYFK